MNYDGVKCFFHVDLDAFFASVEALLHPEWRGKPLVVGGLPGDRRAVVSTASYEARKYGIHSAMPLSRAVELCPNAVFVRGNHKLYSEYSQKIMEIFSQFSPDVRQISIDEAFLDMTGTGRLFGDPIETAKKLKAEVFKKTGLTVSVGIASNAYISKISSGLKKPDGLYAVLPGQEEAFMLSLPLEKVWGVGEKTLARLRESGFNSTSDIRKHSQKLLESIFGPAEAAFLYSIVRGMEPPGFLSEPKSHSAGIETTYEYDLTEWNAIEQAFLYLSEELMFRLLRQNVTGKTVSVKIRYDDFSTVAAQATRLQNVTSVEDLYSRAMEIFRKKYEAGRAIRLLGISVNNTVDADEEKQNELFDFGEGKRKALEKSILKLEQKNPGIKIHKARLLNPNPKKIKCILAAFFLQALLLFSGKEIFSAEGKSIQPSGAGSIPVTEILPPEIFPERKKILDWNFRDKKIEWSAQGYWTLNFRQTVSATFGFGKAFSVKADMPIFEQRVDLSLWFMMDRHYFFEAAFQDEFSKNTIALGYTNGEDSLKNLRISNRNIVFPKTYSIDDVGRGIGGGENQAPGVMASFSSPDDKWTFDAAIRYDMLTSRDKSYYGKNSVEDREIKPEDFLTGRIFVLPTFEITSSVDSVYVESYSGTYKDQAGRKYKRLSSSDFLAIPSRKMILLSPSAGASKKNGRLPAVAVSFKTQSAKSELLSAMGTFGTSENPGNGFLGDVQRAFGKDLSQAPNISEFSYGKKDSRDSPAPDFGGSETEGFFGKLEGVTVLFVQHPAGFSPFSQGFRYDTGTSIADEIQVVYSQSKKTEGTYTVFPADDDFSLVNKDYFSEERHYADVYLTATKEDDYAKANARFPFAGLFPGTYLGYREDSGLTLLSRTYMPVERFDIGTKAVDGTVLVYKNGVVDTGAKYDSETGEVRLSSGVGSGDKIYIVWFEDSSSFETGAVAGAAGFKYNWTKNFSGDISTGSRWTLSPGAKYAEEEKKYFGYTTLSSRVEYKGENFSGKNTISGTVENKNTTGLYKVLGFEDAGTTTLYNSQEAGKNLPEKFSPVINSRPNDKTGLSLELNPEKNCSEKMKGGSSDSEITGYKIPVSWNWTGEPGEWAAGAILLSGQTLSNAQTFSFALKGSGNFSGDVYLQLGVSADEDFEVENSFSVPTWKISEHDADDVQKNFDKAKEGWQTVTVALTDADRAQCTKNHNARLIVLNNESEPEKKSGTIYFGPYEIAESGVFTSADKSLLVTNFQTKSSNPDASALNTKTNFQNEISWKSLDEEPPQNSKITVTKHFKEADGSDYAEINLLFKFSFDKSVELKGPDGADSFTDEEALVFLLDTDSSGAQGEGKIFARAAIFEGALQNIESEKWHTLTIQRKDNSLYIDGEKIPSSMCAVQTDASVLPTRMKIVFDTKSKNAWKKSGSLFIDELYFSKTAPHFIVQDTNCLEYKKEGGILQTQGGFPILSDFYARASTTEIATLYTKEDPNKNEGSFSADAKTGFTLTKIKFNAEASHQAKSENVISAAAHSIETREPLFKTLSFSGAFNFDKEGKTGKKDNFLKADFSKLNIPLVVEGKAKSESNEWKIKTGQSVATEFKSGSKNAGYRLRLNAESAQTLDKISGQNKIGMENYFSSWLDFTKKEFSFGEEEASKRAVRGGMENKFFLPVASLSPEINFFVEENYSSVQKIYYSDKDVFELKIPFSVKATSLLLSWKKSSGGITKTSQGGTYTSDFDQAFKSLFDRADVFFAAPFYDLFSKGLSEKVFSKTKNLSKTDSFESEYYSGEYSFDFSRPIFADKRDFFVPSFLGAAFSRDIRAASTLSDTYQAKLKIGWKAFNIFGRTGTIPIASWFEQDEYISSFVAAYRFPGENPKDLSQIYSTYVQANFYMEENGVLKNGAQLDFEDKNNFSIKATVLWKRRGKKSPITSLAASISKKAQAKEIPITRSDSINCAWKAALLDDSSSVRHTHSYDFVHSADFELSKYFSLSTEVNLGYKSVWEKECTITAGGSIGGKLKF